MPIAHAVVSESHARNVAEQLRQYRLTRSFYVERSVQFDPLAFWLFPDWEAGNNLKDPKTVAFWMRDPKQPEVLTPQSSSILPAATSNDHRYMNQAGKYYMVDNFEAYRNALIVQP